MRRGSSGAPYSAASGGAGDSETAVFLWLFAKIVDPLRF